MEWNNKAAGIVSYGSVGGARAAEHLRGILGELLVADVRVHPALSLFTDFENGTVFKPKDVQADSVNQMLDQLIPWATALKQFDRCLGSMYSKMCILLFMHLGIYVRMQICMHDIFHHLILEQLKI